MADTPDKGDPKPPKKQEQIDKLAKPDESSTLVPEILEAVRDSQGTININILLQQITQKTQNSDEAIAQFDRVLELSKKYEEHQVETF